jgi:exo-1,4-beta-D-glucosaminidase
MCAFSLALAAVAVFSSTFSAALLLQDQQDIPFVSSAGSISTIEGWYMQSTAHTSQNMTILSLPDANVSSWYRVGSHGTVMV